VASFATNVHRIQQIFDTARLYKRKVVISGRSMVNVIKVARELKYLKFKDSILVDLKDVNSMPNSQIVLLTTGSQGEPMSVLSQDYAGRFCHHFRNADPGQRKNSRLRHQRFNEARRGSHLSGRKRRARFRTCLSGGAEARSGFAQAQKLYAVPRRIPHARHQRLPGGKDRPR
jgi:hypothetical protein